MIEEVLITKEQLQKRVEELGAQISKDYEGKPIMLVGILKGSVPFMADLMRAIEGDVEIDFMSVSSYGSSTKSSGVVRILKDLDSNIDDKNIIIVEDIVDTGLTLAYLKSHFDGRGPASVKICTLLNKSARRQVELEPDYVGFEIDDKFIVGYGLDFDQKYRQLPYISWIKEQ